MSQNYNYTDLPASDLEDLKKLKFLIENTNSETQEYKILLKNYYEELNDLFSLLYNPLPPEYELEESLLPRDYLEFKKSCLSSPPYTFTYHCKNNIEAIALIEVKSIGFKQAKIYAELLELFKGDLSWFQKDLWGNIYFDVYTAWAWAKFTVKEIALVLLNKTSQSLIIFNENNKLKINQKKGIAISTDISKIYWSEFSCWQEESRMIIDWQEIYDFLIKLKNN